MTTPTSAVVVDPREEFLEEGGGVKACETRRKTKE